MPRLADQWQRWRHRNSAVHRDALVALRTHAGLVIASAARILGNIHDAEDVAQDIAERLLRSPPQSVRNWPAYLRTLSTNAAIDRLRKRRPSETTDQLIDPATPESTIANEQQASALRDAIATLSQKDATLFSLFYFADMGQAQIGEHFEMSENAVAVALHRIRQKLTTHIRTRLQLDADGAES
ncbi:MAG: sigma-70 family RNA polymerase sigma factor [Pseudomonadota bacterium]